jgi:adenylosuccinate lyase
MNRNWSPRKKFTTWRRLWGALARAEKELGLEITEDQIAEMAAAVDAVDIEAAEEKEKELRHDVMSHVHVFAQQCPKAAPIVHLGATSCFVGDNTELIQIRDGLHIVRDRLALAMRALRDQATAHADLPILGFTHFQPAQVTTLGKRVTLWLNDFLMDLRELEHCLDGLPFRGVKGTTGTQASFLALFDGDGEKVQELDRRVARAMGFERVVPVCGQTYSRKIDFQVMSVLSGIAQSAAKMATDIRLLANRREVEEPFGSRQVGSSAMAYKRNPMRSERICSLARFVISLVDNAAQTHANQWLERTLDDSANRRLSLPQAFLGVDIILSLVENVASGLQVWPNVIRRNLNAELPFMATENILMAAVRAGGDRQELHEAIRQHSMEAVRRVKEEGVANDLLDRIAGDPAFAAIRATLHDLVNPEAFLGRAPQQVRDFLAADVDPALERSEARGAGVESEGVHV